MHAIDSITNNTRTAFSFELLPPLKGTGIDTLFHTIDELRELFFTRCRFAAAQALWL